jgi:hypothetical protein
MAQNVLVSSVVYNVVHLTVKLTAELINIKRLEYSKARKGSVISKYVTKQKFLVK